jgi:2-oxoglutarate ferredoxin oxidoreductase subunit beta
MDRKHMTEVFRRANAHQGASFVEIYQNCNVFNDGAFDAVVAKDSRADMLIDLHHGEKIVFGADGEHGVMLDEFGEAHVVSVADVGLEKILVHDEQRPEPSLAFALSRLASGPYEPTPVGIFRAIERPSYEIELSRQLAAAQERGGEPDLDGLLGSGNVWEVV